MPKIILAWVLMTTGVSLALPPEGLENFALLNDGKPSRNFGVDFVYQSPAWRDDFESVQGLIGVPMGSDLFTFGARGMVGPRSGERSAYMGRYDWIFGKGQSFALKYIHEEWSYIASAKEVWGADYNLFVNFGQSTAGFYMALGYYYRWLKQRWNQPWGDPLNYNTRDQESFLQGVFGLKIPLFSDANFITFDLNWRDRFSYYNFDNMAFDAGIYFPGEGFLLRLNGGIRTSAVTMGAGYAAEYYGGMGFVFY